MKEYNFDCIVDRRNTNCAKWDTFGAKYGRDDLIHLGVADMDFKSPPAIIKALQSVVDHGIFGYSDLNEGFYSSIMEWLHNKSGACLVKEDIVFCPRINVSAGVIVRSCTSRGAKILINAPSYSPLQEAISKNGRVPVNNPLVRDGDVFRMDFEYLESVVDDKTEMFILCNPDNPSGRVWSREELRKLANFCYKHNLILFSDEIHSDFIAEGVVFNSVLGLEGAELPRVIYANSITKSFNVPGLIISYLVIQDEDLRSRIEREIDVIGMHNPNIFSVAAVEAAYTGSKDWLEDLNLYIDENEAFFRDFVAKNLPGFRILPREGTVLLWIDYSELGVSEEDLLKWFIEDARVEVYMGTSFGKYGKGYIRVNLGTSIKTLEEALTRMKAAFSRLA